MRHFSLAIALLLALAPAATAQQHATPDDSFSASGPPVSASARSVSEATTTLRDLQEAVKAHPDRYVYSEMYTIERVRISAVVRSDTDQGFFAYIFRVYEPETRATSSVYLTNYTIGFGGADPTIGEKIRSNPKLEGMDARIRFSLHISQMPHNTIAFLAMPSSIEWMDEDGRIVDSTH